MTEAFEEKRINDSSFQKFLLFKIAWLEIFQKPYNNTIAQDFKQLNPNTSGRDCFILYFPIMVLAKKFRTYPIAWTRTLV